MKRKSNTSALRMVCGALALAAAGAAQAQWTVTDPGHTGFTYGGWLAQGEQMGKELKQWESEMKHYEQQLADAKKVFEAQSMPMTMDFEQRSLDYGMTEQCKKYGNKVGKNLDKLTSASSIPKITKVSKNGEIYAQQHQVCQEIVYLQNSKYNELVKVMNVIQERQSELTKLDSYRSGIGTSQGKLATSSNQMNAFSARMQMDMQYVNTVIATYDGYIDLAKKEQQRLAKLANEGVENTIFNALMQGAVLKGAFAGLRAARSL